MEKEIIKIIKRALKEDMPKGDITTDSLIPKDHQSKAKFIAKDSGIISGLEVAEEVFRQVGGDYKLVWNFKDGDFVNNKDIIGTVEGNTRTILKAERLSLNIMQRMSGIATNTYNFTKECVGDTKILDTRKTTPNLRILERKAVLDGKGTNHRLNLSDMVLIKDNHIDAVGSITKACLLAKKNTKDKKIEVEVETLEQFMEALDSVADIIMLDNMSNELMAECVKLNNKKKKIEASGNMTVERIKSVSELGVDYISVGALTYASKALDISLKFH